MGDLQDPTDGGTSTYHMFGHMNCGDIPLNIGLKNRPKIYGIGTSNQSVPVAWPLILWDSVCLYAIIILYTVGDVDSL